MKCDLHVHTVHSGMCTVPVASRFCRECYSEPAAVYHRLKQLGMDLVTVTDHDSIDAAEVLRAHSDFFLSVEATCRMPSGTEVHVGIYDITERQHIETQRRRDDFPSLIAYLAEQQLFFSVNHVLSGLTGRRHVSDFEIFEGFFPAFEVLNGTMPPRTNALASELACLMRKAPVAGSDAHTLATAGAAYTEIPAARTRRDFLDCLRAGQGIARGSSGGFLRLTRDVLSICFSMLQEKPWLMPAAPLFLGVPVVTLINCALEAAFAGRWHGTVLQSRPGGAVAVSGVEVSAS